MKLALRHLSVSMHAFEKVWGKKDTLNCSEIYHSIPRKKLKISRTIYIEAKKMSKMLESNQSLSRVQGKSSGGGGGRGLYVSCPFRAP